MKAIELYTTHDVHHWTKYKPHEGHYAEFNPNVVAAGFKIHETYLAFCNARTHLSASEADDFGSLTGSDDFSKTYFVTTLLQSAIAFYNYCIDLSWQAVWFYCAPDSDYRFIDDEDEYIRYCKWCTSSAVKLKLYLGKKEELMHHVESFYTSGIPASVRTEYNYLKHRGAYHILGLGVQYANMHTKVNGESFNLMQNRVFDNKDWIEKLICFDKLFVQYFEKVVSFIIPPNYTQTTNNFECVLRYYKKRKSMQT
ncbi:hypothetical protein PAT3040_04143 [Paenibacillus agaridevorans]|uniref:Cthe-2314-like HEPN domain-containing protein n=1 Tax=Paenibacillus agaridevorans TaxID=171404 RepID=A0A2R5ES13_9BACL|nr:hypothetical protein [Paenibacillus agaridevorans]GBG09496.1 hypothetical protein PAT3040_04143 [Paenibacillus agaridevorans]